LPATNRISGGQLRITGSARAGRGTGCGQHGLERTERESIMGKETAELGGVGLEKAGGLRGVKEQ